MLAAELDGAKLVAANMPDGAARELDWECPVCGQRVIYVKQSKGGRVSHFRHETEPDHGAIGESVRHEQIKLNIYQTLRQFYDVVEVEYEVGSRIADVFVAERKGRYGQDITNGVVVEVQCAKQPVDDFKERTRDYSDNGVATLWLVDRETYTPDKRNTSIPGVLYSDHVKWLENVYGGSLYLIEDVGEYNEFHIRNAFRTVQDSNGRYYDKEYKTVGKLQNRTPITWDFTTETSYSVYKVAHP